MDCYERLARHLDRLPGGYPPTETGAELRMLKRLFTPDEADLAVYLTLNREEVSTIGLRAGILAAEAEQRLSEMAHKGLIFSVQSNDDRFLYQAAPWVVGIYEFQLNRLNEEFIRDFNELVPARMKDPRAKNVIPQIRTIPLRRSVEAGLEILPYEMAAVLVGAHDKFAVAPCICRRKADISGKGCDAPLESCLMLGDWADYFVRNSLGRYIDSEEVKDILAKADEANLVIQPSNSQKASFMCTCCGCCCGVLTRVKMHPKPSTVVASPFIATADPETCDGCGTCVERCQMDAIDLVEQRVSLNSDRCIGCGLCVSTCPTDSFSLVRKPVGEQVRVPTDMVATWKEVGVAWAE